MKNLSPSCKFHLLICFQLTKFSTFAVFIDQSHSIISYLYYLRFD